MDYTDLFSFRKMITPVIIQILFWIGAGIAVLAGLVMIIAGLASRGGGLMLMGLIYIIIGPILVRVYCEVVILLFKIYDELVLVRKAIAGPRDELTGFPVTPIAPPPAQ